MGSIRRYSPLLLCAIIILAALACVAQTQGAMPPQPRAFPVTPLTQSSLALPEFLQAPAQAPRLQELSYLVIRRTHGHERLSDPETFRKAANAMRDLLRSRQISFFEDPSRVSIETGEEFSLQNVLKLARDAGASHLLYVEIDRPFTKWLKIQMQCYDMNGRILWQEEGSHGGGWNSSKSVDKITAELGNRLRQRVGGPGLPQVIPGSQEQPPQPAGSSF